MIKGKNYCIDSRNVLFHELIGLNAEVVNSFDKSKKFLKGRIVDETRNTIVLETSKGEKVLGKKEIILKVDLIGDEKEINCSKILARPEDRTKNWRKIDDWNKKCLLWH